MTTRSRLLPLGLFVALAALVAAAFWQTGGGPPARIAVTREPTAIMGTSCLLVAVVPREEQTTAERGLAAAESELRRVEALMSTWIEASEISRFNAAPAGVEVPLSPDSLTVLRSAREEHQRSDGAFDITCRPLIELWRAAGRRGTLPAPEELEQARRASSWEHVSLAEAGAAKSLGTACVDLGGNAKGYGIDLAIDALRHAGVVGGLVDVGGDVSFFGEAPDGRAWTLDVRDPAGEGVYRTLRLGGRQAVCTSGDYARFVEIEGRRFSHIVDPRTGWPAEIAPSVTVIAPSALLADSWATALSVLGAQGFSRLPAGVEAMLLQRDATGGLVEHRTPGFPEAEAGVRE